MAQQVQDLSARVSHFVAEGGSCASPVQRAKNAIVMRRHRKGYFDEDLFADPAWNILLHLFVAYEEEAPVCVSDCCTAAGVHEPAALRWIEILADRGLLKVSDDAGDDRLRIVRLTDPAHHSMRDFWQEQETV